MSIRPQRILWPTDFSPLSLKGAEYARAFCETFDAKLHVIHVAPLLVYSSSTTMMTAGDLGVGMTDVVGPAESAMKAFLKKHFAGDGAVESKVVSGQAWYEICRYASEKRIDLIVIATHGVSGFKHLLMGSTAERVVQHATCPVLAVKSVERDFVAQQKGKAQRASGRSTRGASKRAGRG